MAFLSVRASAGVRRSSIRWLSERLSASDFRSGYWVMGTRSVTGADALFAVSSCKELSFRVFFGDAHHLPAVAARHVVLGLVAQPDGGQVLAGLVEEAGETTVEQAVVFHDQPEIWDYD